MNPTIERTTDMMENREFIVCKDELIHLGSIWDPFRVTIIIIPITEWYDYVQITAQKASSHTPMQPSSCLPVDDSPTTY